MKNVALVGLGRWGKNILRELVNLHTEVTVLLNTPNTEKEQWLRENYPSVAYTYSKEDIIENPDITHVCVATPMGTHFDVAKDFIVAGKKVFLEKPITIESKEGRELLALVGEKGSDFMVGHIFLYHECLRTLKELLEGKKVIVVQIEKTARSEQDITAAKELFYDAFIHEISIVLKLFGQPVHTTLLDSGNALEMDFATFKVTIQVKKSQGEKVRRFEVETTTGGYLWLNDTLFEKGNSTPLSTPTTSPLNNELGIFLNTYDALKSEISLNNEIGVQSVEILETLWAQLKLTS